MSLPTSGGIDSRKVVMSTRGRRPTSSGRRLLGRRVPSSSATPPPLREGEPEWIGTVTDCHVGESPTYGRVGRYVGESVGSLLSPLFRIGPGTELRTGGSGTNASDGSVCCVLCTKAGQRLSGAQ
eukprot:3131554-Rhodomonas_salina.1